MAERWMAKIVRAGDSLQHAAVWNVIYRIVVREIVAQLRAESRCNLSDLK
jgi:hypothetical protein